MATADVAEVRFTPYGNYDVAFHNHRCFIPTKDKKTGEDTVVPITQKRITLRHKSGQSVVFKQFEHIRYTYKVARNEQGVALKDDKGRAIKVRDQKMVRLLWSDSRAKGSVQERDVVSEIARMCFAGDYGQASVVMATELAQL